jgi:hypothetical protein
MATPRRLPTKIRNPYRAVRSTGGWILPRDIPKLAAIAEKPLAVDADHVALARQFNDAIFEAGAAALKGEQTSSASELRDRFDATQKAARHFLRTIEIEHSPKEVAGWTDYQVGERSALLAELFHRASDATAKGLILQAARAVASVAIAADRAREVQLAQLDKKRGHGPRKSIFDRVLMGRLHTCYAQMFGESPEAMDRTEFDENGNFPPGGPVLKWVEAVLRTAGGRKISNPFIEHLLALMNNAPATIATKFERASREIERVNYLKSGRPRRPIRQERVDRKWEAERLRREAEDLRRQIDLLAIEQKSDTEQKHVKKLWPSEIGVPRDVYDSLLRAYCWDEITIDEFAVAVSKAVRG